MKNALWFAAGALSTIAAAGVIGVMQERRVLKEVTSSKRPRIEKEPTDYASWPQCADGGRITEYLERPGEYGAQLYPAGRDA